MNNTPLLDQWDADRIAVGTSAMAECCCGNTYLFTKEDEYSKATGCSECVESEIENRYQQARKKIEDAILEQTPVRFRLTDTAHPDFNLKLWQKIEPWRPTDVLPWFGLFGPTGKCKTRCSFLLFRTVALNMIYRGTRKDMGSRPPSCFATSAHMFGAKVLERFSDDREEKPKAERYLARCRSTDLLLLDDVDKIKVTTANGVVSSAGAELHAMLDHRHAENLATIWSANVPPEGIVAGMPENLAAPLAGRIRECSTIYQIK